MIYKTGTKLTDKDTRQVFTVSESTREMTKYCGHGVSGECPTRMLMDQFEVDGEPLPTVAEALAKVSMITPENVDRFVRIGAGLFTSAACVKFLIGA